MAERFVSPHKPPSGIDRELLIILMEEAAEVQQRAAKALRFGIQEVQPGQPQTNAERLGEELGDFVEVALRCLNRRLICADAMDAARERKVAKLDQFMQSREDEVTP